MVPPAKVAATQAVKSSARSLKKRLFIALSLLLVVIATPFAVMQVLGIQLPFYFINHPTLFFSAMTFPKGISLPYVNGNIRAVAHDEDSLWIGGDAGLLARLNSTHDRRWTCLSLSNDSWRKASCDAPPQQAAPAVLAMEWTSDRLAFLVASNSAIYYTADGGGTWSRERDLSRLLKFLSGSSYDRTIASTDQTSALVQPTIASVPLDRTTDGGFTFTASATPADCATLVSNLRREDRSSFRSPSYVQLSPSCVASLLRDGPTFYLKPNDPHSVWSTATYGSSDEIRITAPSRAIIPIIHLPAPWYFLVLFLAGLLLYRASKARVQSEIVMDDTVANLGVSDRPLNWGDGDAMGFHAMARGISLFLRNANTGLPLVLAVNGAWGSGKSSLMNLLWANMETSARMVWFNAWHHQSEEQLLAALLQAVRVQSLDDLWSRRGMTRRLRLLFVQLGKNWPITTLLSFLSVALLMLIVHIVRQLSSDAIDTARLTSQIKLWAALISSVVAFAGTFKKLKTSVGSLIANPASLLASYSGSVTIDDLSAQTTFRQRFSNDFKKLINVLGDRRLVIIIDDLDRCRPEKIREVMEAVNFLVTSGECAIILGLARPYVEHFLGVAFKDFVEGMPPGLVGLDPAVEWKDAELDRTYAELYLEKLIQIDITIPKPSETQAGAIIVPVPQNVASAPVLDDEVAARILKRRARETSLRALFRIVDKWTGPVLGTLVLASIFTYAALKWRFPVYERIDRTLVTQEAKTNTTPKLPAKTPATDISQTRTSPASLSGGQTPDKLLELVVTPASLSTPEGPYITYPMDLPTWLIVTGFTLVLLIFLAVLLRILLTTVESLKVNDSPEFQRALFSWIPLIHSIFHSPRSLKRYMNKVRFLAMRQRGLTEADPIAPADRLASRIAERLYPKLEGEPDIHAATIPPADATIPDDILIVLVAIESDNILWPMLTNWGQLPEEGLLDESGRKRFPSDDRALFNSLRDVWPRLREHLPNYIELAGKVDTN